MALQPERASPYQRIVAVNAENGQHLCSFDTKAPLAAAPVVADGVLLFGDADNRLVALDARTGAIRWDKEKRTDGRLLVRPFVVGDTLFTADRHEVGQVESPHRPKGPIA
ncbi:PQQ-binding-like beta-propeller repeat protein [Streptomyces sp. NRRL S-1448]|uniref:outer membrane protein assembly factor BamB family protein n=1 Tax=Streptomyces sp. NRRL S-1448 TaxID=1463883 RepID=UPI002D21DDA0|nr:PQQ-binding-like beta-propeller repeat protein [Streptomyces sp. NRRL S-1448]